jgi:MoxR-like ATPase
MAEPATPTPAAVSAAAQQVARDLSRAVTVALAGKPDVVERAVITLLARGHLLIEDVPGRGQDHPRPGPARALGTTFAASSARAT